MRNRRSGVGWVGGRDGEEVGGRWGVGERKGGGGIGHESFKRCLTETVKGH